MAFVVVYDACTLHPASLRDLLIRIALIGVVRARWSDQILDECFRSILRARPDLSAENLQRTRERMNTAIRDVLVTGHEELIHGIGLPDADDRHVVAAAIRCGAQSIVTFNLKDFPAESLTPLGIEAVHPDSFVLDVIDLAPGAVCTAVEEQARVLKSPPRSRAEVLEELERCGLVQSVARLRKLFGVG